MLDAQYRMHPFISVFPSESFYDGKLKNVLDQGSFEKAFPAPWSGVPCFSPVVFFHLQSEMQMAKFSFVNEEEAKFVAKLLAALHAKYPGQDWKSKVAVISPYAEQ
eukprot:1023386-Amphidinium_carterae.1